MTGSPYLAPRELVSLSMTTIASATGMHVSETERQDAQTLNTRVIEKIIAARPNLGSNGFWARNCFVTREAFDADRAKMPNQIDEFQRAFAFLLLCCGRRKTINRKMTSYGFKHEAENAMRDLNLTGYYVSNGMFIVAALALGYRVEHILGTPNAWLNLDVVREVS